MVKIRLARFGRKKDPHFRIVAIDESKKREGESLAVIGYWHPKKKILNIDKDKLKDWVGKGAMLTEGVKKLLQ